MSNEQIQIPAHAIAIMTSSVAQVAETGKQQVVATLAAAIITASGKPWSTEQALELARDIHFTMYPVPHYGAYKEWLKTKDDRLKVVHK